VVTQPSRRAFLTGRRTPATPWGQFCARLSRSCSGQVRWDNESQVRQAWLEPERDLDVLHAQALCREFGVSLLLWDSEAQPRLDQAVLWVDSRASWAQVSLINADRKIWRVDAGVRLSTLRDLGVGVFADMTDALLSSWTLAQWFASAQTSPELAGDLAKTGIIQAQLLLGDGTIEHFGPFGASASTPLKSLAVQKMIPKLFELAQSEDAAHCAQLDAWPCRYRLDTMMSQFGDSPNLAWLFKGHGGSLAWLQTLWLQPSVLTQADPLTATRESGQQSAPAETISQMSTRLDLVIKQTLDPTGVFGEIPDAKGLESAQLT